MKKKVFVTSPYDQKAIFGPQGQCLIPTITEDLCGTTGLSSCLVFMPPSRSARPHLHRVSDIIVVVIEGFAASLVGPELEPVFHGPGEFIFIPEDVLHVAVNLSTKQRLIAIEVRTDPKFNADLEVVPEYDDKAATVIADLQNRFEAGELNVPEHWDIINGRQFRFANKHESELF